MSKAFNGNIKAFQDGNRFCIVIEDCSPALKAHLIQQLNPTLIGDVKAEPVAPMTQKAQNTKDQETEQCLQLLLTQKNPSTATDDAFRRLARLVKSNGLQGGTDRIRNALNAYLLLRFKNADPARFIGMNDAQCDNFLRTFGVAIPQKMRDDLELTSMEAFFAKPKEQRDAIIHSIVVFFASLNGKENKEG